MAATGFVPHLPPPEDSMEMSSPTNRLLDEDIDIDFDDYAEAAHHPDDEVMHEDGDVLRPGTANDELMGDDDHYTEPVSVEEEMHDDVADGGAEYEDELIDYTEEEHTNVSDHTITNPVTVESLESSADITEPKPEGVLVSDSELPPAGQTYAAEQLPSSGPIVDNVDAVEVKSVDTTTVELESERHVIPEHEASPQVQAQDDVEAIERQDSPASRSAPANEDGEADPKQVEQVTSLPPLDTTSATFEQAPASPTDTGLHPMLLWYYETSLPLFKSHAEQSGLLDDDNMASVSIGELLQACRQRLAIQTGENISEDQDFRLDFRQINITIREDSRTAFEISLDDVLETYLQLHQNAESSDVPAFELTLTLYDKPTSRLDKLRQFASEGHTIHDLPHLFPDLSEVEEYEEYDETGSHTEHDAADNDAGEYDEAVDDHAEIAGVGDRAVHANQAKYDEEQHEHAENETGHEGQEYHEAEVKYNEEEEEKGNSRLELPPSPSLIKAHAGPTEDVHDVEAESQPQHVSEESGQVESNDERSGEATAGAVLSKSQNAPDVTDDEPDAVHPSEVEQHDAGSHATFDGDVVTEEHADDDGDDDGGEQFHSAYDLGQVDDGREQTTVSLTDEHDGDEQKTNGHVVESEAANNENLEELDFDDDEEIPLPPDLVDDITAEALSKKRSYDDLVDLEDFGDEEHDAKKARAG